MGKFVNVVLSGGKVATVSEEDAERLRGSGAGRLESSAEAAQRAGADVRAEQAGGLGSALRAGAEGAADVVTGGLYGRAAGYFGGDEVGLEMRQAAAEHSTARTVGEVAALVAPTGWLGGGAKAVGELGAIGQTLRAGEAIGAAAGSKAVGRLAEGALFGIQGHLAETNVTGDPLTIEGTVEAAGMGALLNYGVGVVGDRLVGAGRQAVTLTDEAVKLRQAVDATKEGAPLLEAGPVDSSWNTFRTAFTAQQKAEQQALREIETATKKYEDFVGSNQKLTIAIKRAEQMIHDIEGSYSPLGSPTEVVDGQTRRVRDVLDETTGEQHTQIATAGNNKPPISPELKARLDEYQARISNIYKKKSGGFELNSAPSSPPPTTATAPSGVTFSTDTNAASAGTQSRHVIEASVNGQKAGVIRLAVGDDGNYYVNNVVVLPAFRRLGVGTELYTEAARMAGKEGLALTSGTSTTDEAAALWRKLVQNGRATEIPGGGFRMAAPGSTGAGAGRATRSPWVKNPSIPPDPRGALEDLRTLQDELTNGSSSFSKRSGALAELPSKPPAVDLSSVPAPVKLPSSPREFARMKPESVGRIANAMGGDAQREFERFTQELGLAPQETPAATAAAVHAKLNFYVKSAETVKQALAEGSEAQAGGIIGWARRQLKKAAKYAVARAADVGGVMGAFTRTGAGEAAGAVMDRFEQSMLDARLLEGKLGAQSKARELVAKYADAAGKGVAKLGPVTAYLATSFPSGEPDPETDPRRQAVNRINDIQRTAMLAPDGMFATVESMLGHPGDVGWKLHNKVMSGLLHLSQVVPKDPGLDFRMFESGWTPEWQDTMALAHRLEALQNPTAAIARAMTGDGHPAAADTLWAVWPAMMGEVANEVAADSERLAKLTHHQAGGLSQLFRTPMSSMQDPHVVLTLQGLYLPQPTQAPQSRSRGAGMGGSRGGGQPGRPPAVRSSVAGSSVAGLISQ